MFRLVFRSWLPDFRIRLKCWLATPNQHWMTVPEPALAHDVFPEPSVIRTLFKTSVGDWQVKRNAASRRLDSDRHRAGCGTIQR